ncbi:uncharacterized protein LOC109098517 isoform X1 [Cyprinus carpio]|uniref:Uncharacterized protein LOC109098517 isoform X1 n=1 Tax=Cyprinus carpio TaxID=7962 RepID=A0A9Q9VWN2_CYPCA|nr:uncharacterized protein LOC109098517 isoform X1 [Cyprinus carpio]XP_042572565.1 uncharacterized protein LOC109098517 isoform X1 [Cyprinus carpio]
MKYKTAFMLMLMSELAFTILTLSTSHHVAVILGERAILPCKNTCTGPLTWTFTGGRKKLEVLKCDKESCTEGGGFKTRLSLSPEKTKNGDLSLTLNHALYNDKGWYEASCGSTFLCNSFLEVLFPVTVNVSVGEDVTLPCYAHTDKEVADDDVNILWKRGDQIAVQVQNGITNYGSGYIERASLSVSGYKDGDLSLSIRRATTLDKGLYLCYHSTEEENGYPGAVVLNIEAYQSFQEKTSGDFLTLDLFVSDPVTISFTSAYTTEILLCSVERSIATCSPDYTHRVSIVDSFLVLRELTASDTGIFTVKDKMDVMIAIYNVAVKSLETCEIWRSNSFILIPISGFLLICTGLYIWTKIRQ